LPAALLPTSAALPAANHLLLPCLRHYDRPLLLCLQHRYQLQLLSLQLTNTLLPSYSATSTKKELPVLEYMDRGYVVIRVSN